MRKLYFFVLSLMLMTQYAMLHAQSATPTSQMEKLSRGLVVAKGSGSMFVSWRLLGTDDEQRTTFNVLRNGETIAEGLSAATCYMDKNGTATDRYQVVTLVDGTPVETSPEATPWTTSYLQLKLDRPASGSTVSGHYDYTPNDCSAGDVDGDGDYEIIVKWDPTNSKDNSQPGVTGPVILDCYKLDGTKLWRVDLGHNIRAGAHYTQFLVYDFDGDGKAEMICRTAPGSRDGLGQYVTEAADDDAIKTTDNTADYVSYSGSTSKTSAYGAVLSGPEYLTVFNGETGKAVHTIFYNPNRAGSVGGAPSGSSKSTWGDTYGGRCDRFLACVAYLDGQDSHPSAVMCRGYYTRAYLWAVDFDGSKLSTKWLHGSVSSTKVEHTDANGTKTTKTYSTNTANLSDGSKTAYGNGNHNLSVADVDGDGCDEIIYGSSAIDHDGHLLYATGYGHGDAMHLGDLDPDRPGLEVFQVHESSTASYGWDLHDAATGEIIYSASGSKDNGRGLAADIIPDSRGYEFWSSNDRQPRSAATGEVAATKSVSVNFRVYWDGSLQDNLLDGTTITAWNNNSTTTKINFANYGNSQSCNSTKATPCLQADLFGDWREEVVLWNKSDSCTLNIFTSTNSTNYRVPTLMHDHVYRMGVAWQNAAYNQPPHLGYYLPDRFDDTKTGIVGIADKTPAAEKEVIFDLQGRRIRSTENLKGLYIIKGKGKFIR